MNLNPRRALRPTLATAGVVAALVAVGCSPVIHEQSAEQQDLVGDVAITTKQCIPLILPDWGFGVAARGTDQTNPCDTGLRPLSLKEKAQLKSAVATTRGETGSYLGQLLLAYEVPNGAEAPAAFSFTETFDQPADPLVVEARGTETAPTPQTGEYRASSSYASELEELYPSGPDTKWAAYASTPVRGSWWSAPHWTSTASFGLAGTDASQPFRGPFAFGTVVGVRRLENEEQANTPIDCDEIDGDCDDDRQGIEDREEQEDERRSRSGRATARKLSSSAIKVSTRDLAVAPKGDEVNIPSGQSGEIPFELRYAGTALSGVSFALKGNASLAGATVTAVPDTFVPADDQTSTVTLRVSVPAGTPVGPQNVQLVATLPNGQQRSGGTQFNVLAANAVPSQEVIVAASRACVSRRSFTIRLRGTKRDPLVSAVVTVNGKRVKTIKKRRITAPVQLAGLAKGRFTVKITAKTRSGKTRTGTRKYLTCTPKRKGGTPKL